MQLLFTSSHRKRLLIVVIAFFTLLTIITVKLVSIMTMQADDYGYRARAVQERERSIKAKRGSIYDRNGVVLAGNQAVCSISVIYNQIEDPETVIRVLSEKLELPEEDVRRRVEKRSVREKIKSNVDKELADEIRAMNLAGVMIDEDYKRYYPYSTLASHVLGFTGSDNQGIVGLEVYYDDLLMGENGSINTVTNARGIEVENMAERRVEGTAGQNLVTSIDINIQQYITQKALEVLEKKQAKRVCIIVMNPQNGEIYALADVPEYNLNEPFTLNYETDETVTQDMWNQMWRNYCISDTYEPGSTFKIVTATTAFEQGVLRVEDQFYCPGYHIVEDRRIRCHKVAGHGAETFREGIMNSCNPVFMQVGERIGVDGFYDGLRKLGLFEQTGVDLPGEANSIFHKQEKVGPVEQARNKYTYFASVAKKEGPVELATMSFGQSFQITPLQLMRAASAVVNGGNLVTPHFGVYTTDENNNVTEVLKYETKTGAVSTATSETMKGLLEAVVAEGTGHRAYIAGYSIGGKTATSEKLPRSENRYISSFLGFSPADNPQVMTLILIDEPQGIYYGGTIAAPVVGEIYDNILPYLGIYKDENAEEETTQTISIDDAVF